jgi:hypothetical protein
MEIVLFWDLNIPEKSPLLSLGGRPLRTRSERVALAPKVAAAARASDSQ